MNLCSKTKLTPPISNLVVSLPTQREGPAEIDLFTQNTHTHTHVTHSEADNQGSLNMRKINSIKDYFKKEKNWHQRKHIIQGKQNLKKKLLTL